SPQTRWKAGRQLCAGPRAGGEKPRLPDRNGRQEKAAAGRVTVAGSALATSRHVVRRGGESNFAVPPAFVGKSEGFRRWAVVAEDAPAVHTGFAMCTLEARGWVATHVHSYEESVYILRAKPSSAPAKGFSNCARA